MEQLKKISGVARQHYEKIVLVLVLVLMGGAALLIYGQSQEERQRIKASVLSIDQIKVKPVKPVDLTRVEQAIQAAAAPPAVVMSGNHNLFNPVRWVYQGGQYIKVQTGSEIGPDRMVVEKIRPLSLIVAFERAVTSGSGDQILVTGYHTVVTNDMAVGAKRRIPQFVGLNDTNKQVFVITAVKGPATNPTEMTLRLKDFNNETASFAPGKPYVRVIGYEADLKYQVNGTVVPKVRVGSTFPIEGDTYKIVDITEKSVVMSDQSNGKRYTIAAPTPQ
jgi:hypothetical protein